MAKFTSEINSLSMEKSGNPCPRFTAPVSAANWLMTVKIVVPTWGSLERIGDFTCRLVMR